MGNQSVHFTNIKNIIIENLLKADKEILVAVAWLTDIQIIETLTKCAKNGIKVSVIFYDDKINVKDFFKELYYKSADIRVSKKLMHNKFCVIDNKIVINGSFNWTYNASNNHENIQISNNQNIANSFKEEFFTLQKSCVRIDSHFKYLLDEIYLIEEEFEKEFVKNKNKYPYFYKLRNFEPNKVHSKSKLKNGYFLITNYEDEYNFNRLKFYLKKDYNLIKIKSVTNKEFICPKYFQKILELENIESEIIQIVKKKYIVEEYYQNYSKSVYSIDNYGNIIVSKINFSEKLNNGFYKINYYNGHIDIFDKNLRKIIFTGKYVELFSDIGIISLNNEGKYGLTNYNGKILANFIFQKYKIIDNHSIEFYEYPVGIAKLSKNMEVILEKYSMEYDEINFKSYLHDYKNLKIFINSNFTNNSCFFDSDSNFKYSILYRESIGKDISLRVFNSLIYNLKNREFNSDKEKEEYIKELVGKYSYPNREKYKPEKSCYIATLVYCDIDHPNVEYLRNFRDKVLNKSFTGKLFIKVYYIYSPKIVSLIKPYKKLHLFLKFILDNLINIAKSHNLISKVND